MKIGFIADIHLDDNKDHPVLESIGIVCREKGCNLLLVAGDIHHTVTDTQEGIAQLEKICGIPVRYVPGNHDLWSDDLVENPTDEIYRAYLKDPHCLCNQPLELGDWVIIGDIGWYDYSFGNHSRFTEEEFKKMECNGRIWRDRIKNAWTKDNRQSTDCAISRLESQMKLYPNHKQIIVTHMLPIKEFTVEEGYKDWAYFNAFLGSDRLETLYSSYPVKYAACGHVHFRKTVQKNGITYLCRCLNYAIEWQDEKDCLAQIREAMDVIEI